MAFLSVDQLVELAAGGAGVKLLDVIVGVIRKRQAQSATAARAGADITRANAEFQEAVSEAAKDLLQDYRDQLHFVRGQLEAQAAELARIKIAHAEEVALMRAEHGNCQREVAELREQLGKLLNGQPQIPYLLGPPS